MEGSTGQTAAWAVRLVWGLGFGVWGLGFGVWGLGFGVWGLGFGVWSLEFVRDCLQVHRRSLASALL